MKNSKLKLIPRANEKNNNARAKYNTAAQRSLRNGWSPSTLRFLFKFRSFDFKNWNYVTRFGIFIWFFSFLFSPNTDRFIVHIFSLANRIQSIFSLISHLWTPETSSSWPCAGYRSLHEHPSLNTYTVRLILPKWVCLLASLVRRSQQTTIKCCERGPGETYAYDVRMTYHLKWENK